MDCGATDHMCTTTEGFMNYEPVSGQDVRLADKSVCNIEGVGDVLVSWQGIRMIFQQVLHVIELRINLVSAGKMSEKGVTTNIVPQGFCEVTRNGKQLFCAKKLNNLFVIEGMECVQQPQAQAVNKQGSDIWHQRLGHLGRGGLEKLKTEQLVRGLEGDVIPKDAQICEDCEKGKSTRQPIPKSTKRRETELLSLVHTDLCGPMPVASWGGNRYVLTVIDDATRKAFVFLLKQKSDVARIFDEWKIQVERGTGKLVKEVRYDNEGEYLSTQLQQSWVADGIRNVRTNSRTPQENGVAERFNRTLLDMMRSMMSAAKAPKSAWGEAITMACYIRNRCPTRALEGNVPQGLWRGYKPSVEHLRPFGCVAYVHVPKETRDKLQSRAWRGAIVGYASNQKAYKIYNGDTRIVVITRDVKFDETKMYFMDKEEKMRDVPEESIDEYILDEKDLCSEPTQVERTVQAREVRCLRPREGIKPPTRFADVVEVSNTPTYREALEGQDSKTWMDAIQKEYNTYIASNGFVGDSERAT